MSTTLTRRDALKVGAFGAAALALPFVPTLSARSVSQLAASKLPKPYTLPFRTPPVAQARSNPAYPGAAFYRMEQRLLTPEIIPGFKTPIFGYFDTIGGAGGTPGPTIRVQQGQTAVVRQANKLPETHPALAYRDWTSTHLHGSPSRPQYDGYASDMTQPGQWKDYVYENRMSARTLWYHDHGVHHTAENAYMGLAAMYISTDPVERALPLPKGEFDVPLVLGDKAFTSTGALLFDDNGHSSTFGDVILVNGIPWPNMQVKRRKYRFRLLNASVSRGFKLALSDGTPLTVIGTDGGLMPAPQTVPNFRIGMAERYEVVIDFAKYQKGAKIQLKNLGVPNATNYDNTDKIMQFEVLDDTGPTTDNAVPSELDPTAARGVMSLTPQGAIKRTMRLERDNGEWKVSGVTWKDIEDSGFTLEFANPQAGSTELWTIENRSGGWFHPLHIHLVDFQVVARNGAPPPAHERGPKDVIYTGENEKVDVLMRFHPAGDPNSHDPASRPEELTYPADHGRYMVHCHNLTHEDHDMMTQFCVGEDSDDVDPIRAAAAREDTEPDD
ncbi:multicopper oxidase family protein [Geodermatophilus ruber]|uniref:Multicopper oxidase with three cupredoxin domains (Includes cell division protein FtsP and spore coat protein CotA) n=1 Tax=Geodermatophilus ruber TaxID=504800 RepID=A0A1I3ZGI8_9ACTN|nr:multicopper oxidase domain-containing protein [Geodermatophilus ruber]SFK42699.1 Multicopper oxidase with three cupredoxin domains (includes cell division protein FtsP and spore coat protein CotA) [Geodermatophilus ruber]